MTPVLVKPGLFRDRREAGRRLAEKLAAYANRPDVLVLALPRGGVPVGYEVARALGAPLDVFVVRKLGVPGYEELAMGAVATGGVRVLNDQLVERLGIPDHVIDAVAGRRPGDRSHHAGRNSGIAAAESSPHRRRGSDRIARNLRGDQGQGRRRHLCHYAGAVPCSRPLVPGFFADDG
jgi:hypothetical protein